MTPEQLLVEAASVLLKYGWTTHSGVGEENPRCVGQALYTAYINNPSQVSDYVDAYELLRERIEEKHGEYIDVTTWNDSQESIEPILEVLFETF